MIDVSDEIASNLFSNNAFNAYKLKEALLEDYRKQKQTKKDNEVLAIASNNFIIMSIEVISDDFFKLTGYDSLLNSSRLNLKSQTKFVHIHLANFEILHFVKTSPKERVKKTFGFRE